MAQGGPQVISWFLNQANYRSYGIISWYIMVIHGFFYQGNLNGNLLYHDIFIYIPHTPI